MIYNSIRNKNNICMSFFYTITLLINVLLTLLHHSLYNKIENVFICAFSQKCITTLISSSFQELHPLATVQGVQTHNNQRQQGQGWIEHTGISVTFSNMPVYVRKKKLSKRKNTRRRLSHTLTTLNKLATL